MYVCAVCALQPRALWGFWGRPDSADWHVECACQGPAWLIFGRVYLIILSVSSSWLY